MNQPAAEPALSQRAWWRHMNRYHWYVFALAALGWLFDTMDGQIFVASRADAIKSLMTASSPDEQRKYGGFVTSLFILGWASGGLVFGIIGDKWGRAKTMALTIGIYAIFTGLSGLSRTWWQFGCFRFCTGLGVGGEFAAGAALVAEVMPEPSRAKALGMLQALSAVGNIIGASLYGFIFPRWGWEVLYGVGAFPAVLAVIVRLGLKEPERWMAAKAAALQAGSSAAAQMGRMSELFSPRWRRNTLVGLNLGVAGVLGLWGAGFFSPELIKSSFPELTPEAQRTFQAVLKAQTPEAQLEILKGFTEEEQKHYRDLVSQRLKPRDLIPAGVALSTPLNENQKAQLGALLEHALTKEEISSLITWGLVLQQIGAFLGIYAFSVAAARLGRRLAFLFAFLIAWFSVGYVFYFLRTPGQVYWLFPLLGFGTLAPFGGYALYFPELFPTRLRTTGTGFCYNTGRFVSTLGPFTLGVLAHWLQGQFETSGFRLAALTISCAYAIGIVALIWAPETVNEPLPEDEKVLAH